jgi:hypothetical protein
MHCTGVRAPLPYPDTARLSPPACHRERWFPTDFDWWAAQQIVQLKLGREATKVFLYGNGTCNEPGVFCHLPLLPPPSLPPPLPPTPLYITPTHPGVCALFNKGQRPRFGGWRGLRKALLKVVTDRGLHFEAAELRHWDGAPVRIDRKVAHFKV